MLSDIEYSGTYPHTQKDPLEHPGFFLTMEIQTIILTHKKHTLERRDTNVYQCSLTLETQAIKLTQKHWLEQTL